MLSLFKQPKTISNPKSNRFLKSTIHQNIKMPASKLILQQNHIKDSSTITSTITTSTTNTYINGQQNGNNTKVVRVTSETLEIDNNDKTTSTSNNGTDEELTSLTWLHDKNLLKGNITKKIHIIISKEKHDIKYMFLFSLGINSISCPSNVKNMNNNHLKIVTDNASIKSQSQHSMNSKSSSSGAVTPTSDFIDDSGVSEDNASSVTSDNISGSEQGSSIYIVRTTPKSFAMTSRERDSDTIDNEDIDDANNNTINKNRTNSNQAPPATSSIIHLSPGRSTVQVVTPNNTNPVIITANSGIKTQQQQQLSTQSLTSSSSSVSTATSTPHTHFHKKYIKAMNALNGNGSDTTTTFIQTSISNSNSEVQVSLPSTVVSVSSPTTNTIYTIPMKTEFR